MPLTSFPRGLWEEIQLTAMAKLPALLVWPFLLLLGSCPILAADSVAPSPVMRVGATEKICQLTGDIDWESGEPTAAKTFSNFGLDAVDLGYPVETGDKLILLFGDSWPPPHGGGRKAKSLPMMPSAKSSKRTHPIRTPGVSGSKSTAGMIRRRSLCRRP
jgi:hypothetical protein